MLCPSRGAVYDPRGLQASYVLTEADYGTLEAESGWAGRLVLLLSSLATVLRPGLTPSNWEVLFGSLLDKLAARVEGLLGRKSFNQLGGLQLDREVRLLISGLGELTGRTVRDRLARLSQMAVLLGLESVEELLDYWGPGSGVGGAGGTGGGSGGEGAGGGGAGGFINWRLSPAEVRGMLVLRSDWGREAVMALPL